MYNEFIRSRINGKLVFDIGANIGLFSRMFADAGAKVVAFEPLKHLVDGNKANYKNVIVENICVSDTQGVTKFFHSTGDPSMSSCSDKWRETHKAARKGKLIEVESNTLNSLINKYGVPTYIKIDVEGHENYVLKTLKTPVSIISLEYSVGYVDVFAECLNKLKEIEHATFFMVERTKDKKSTNTFRFTSTEDCLSHLEQHPPIHLRGDLLSLMEKVDGL